MTLAETIRTFRWGARLIFLGSMLLILGRLFFNFSVNIVIPRPPTPPTPTPPASFGLLPRLNFKTLALDQTSTISYAVLLISPHLPTGPGQLPVYRIAPLRLSLLAEERASAQAKNLGFTGPPTITEENYLWQEDQAQLRIEKKSLNLFYNYNYRGRSDLFVPALIYSEGTALQIGRQFLQEKGLLGGLENSKAHLQMFEYQSGTLIPTRDFRRAAAFKVDFAFPPVGEYPILTSPKNEGLVKILFTPNPVNRRAVGQVLQIQSIRWPVLWQQFSNYPLRTGKEAWEEFKNQAQGLIYLRDRQGNELGRGTKVKEFRLKEAFLGYLMTDQYQPFLQPIWVFKGEALLREGRGTVQWLAYRPAVDSRWIAP